MIHIIFTNALFWSWGPIIMTILFLFSMSGFACGPRVSIWVKESCTLVNGILILPITAPLSNLYK